MSYIIAVDFDGTMCEGDKWPNIGEPDDGVLAYLKEKQASGAKLILWTCRAGKELEEAIKWSEQHGIIFDAVNDNLPETKTWFSNADDCRKIFANEYLDDRAKNPGDLMIFYADNKPICAGWARPHLEGWGEDWLMYDGKVYRLEKSDLIEPEPVKPKRRSGWDWKKFAPVVIVLLYLLLSFEVLIYPFLYLN